MCFILTIIVVRKYYLWLKNVNNTIDKILMTFSNTFVKFKNYFSNVVLHFD